MTLPTRRQLSRNNSASSSTTTDPRTRILGLQRLGVQYVARKRKDEKEYSTYNPVEVRETGGGFEVIYQSTYTQEKNNGFRNRVEVNKREFYNAQGDMVREIIIARDSDGKVDRTIDRNYETGKVRKDDVRAEREEAIRQEQELFKAGTSSDDIAAMSPGERREAYGRLGSSSPGGSSNDPTRGALTYQVEADGKKMAVSKSVYDKLQAGGFRDAGPRRYAYAFGTNKRVPLEREEDRRPTASPLTTSIIENASGAKRPSVNEYPGGRIISLPSSAQSQLVTGTPYTESVQVERPQLIVSPSVSASKKEPSTRLERYEARVADLEQRERTYFGGKGFKNIDDFSNFVTFGGGRQKRGRIGRLSQQAVSGAISFFPFILPQTVYYGSQKAWAYGEAATLREVRGDILPALRRPFKKLEQGPFSFLPGGTKINDEGILTLGFALAGGLPRGISAARSVRNAPSSTGSLLGSKQRGRLFSTPGNIKVRGKVLEQYEAYGYDPNYPLRPRGTSTVSYFEKTPFRQSILGRVAVKTTITAKRTGYITKRQQYVKADGTPVGKLFVTTQRPGLPRATVRVFREGRLVRTGSVKPLPPGRSTVEVVGESKLLRAQPEQISRDTVRQSVTGRLDLGVRLPGYAGYLEARGSAKALSILPRSKVSGQRLAVDTRGGGVMAELTTTPRTPRGRLAVAETRLAPPNERLLTRQRTRLEVVPGDDQVSVTGRSFLKIEMRPAKGKLTDPIEYLNQEGRPLIFRHGNNMPGALGEFWNRYNIIGIRQGLTKAQRGITIRHEAGHFYQKQTGQYPDYYGFDNRYRTNKPFKDARGLESNARAIERNPGFDFNKNRLVPTLEQGAEFTVLSTPRKTAFLNNRIEARATPTSAGEIRATITGSLSPVAKPSIFTRARQGLSMRFGRMKVEQPMMRPYKYTSYKNPLATARPATGGGKATGLPPAPREVVSGGQVLELTEQPASTAIVGRLEAGRNAWTLDVPNPDLRAGGSRTGFQLPVSRAGSRSSQAAEARQAAPRITSRAFTQPFARSTPVLRASRVSRSAPVTRERSLSRLTPVTRTNPVTRERSITRALPLSKVQPVSRIENVQKVSSVTKMQSVSKLTQVTRITPVSRVGRGLLTTRTPFLPPLIPPLFPLKKTRKARKKSRDPFGLFNQPKRYQPSAYAIVADIYGEPTKKGVFTGLGLRPQRRRRKK